MARARNIKPAFFTNDGLAECEPLARLLFIGLWTIADRAGRLHDRPKKIKVEVLPYDDCDCDKLLNQLESKGFILRYDIEKSQYIQILNFEKHQNPHCKESESAIPAPCLHHTSTEQALLIPDSLNLIPDSLSGKKKAGEQSHSQKSKFVSVDKPEDVSEETWQSFVDLRKAKKAPITPAALKMIQNQCKLANWDIESALIETCGSGWQSFKAEYVVGKSKPVKKQRAVL